MILTAIPLYYAGSRDNYLRVIALDRDSPTELWSLNANAVSPTKWNNDWDGAPLVIDDYLFEGGENSQFHIVKLNRGYGADGKVTVAPQLVFNAPGWDQELLTTSVNNDVSIENSVAIVGDTVYFANSGGLLQGWDISTLAEGGSTRAGLPVLDRRRHGCVGRRRRRGVPLRRIRVRARQRAVAAKSAS